MAVYRLAAVIESSSGDEFAVVRQAPPPPLSEEYINYQDSDLWDLPSTTLKLLAEGDPPPTVVVEGASSCLQIELSKFDLNCALDEVLTQLGTLRTLTGSWLFLKYVEEPEFGPGSRVNTIFIRRLQSNEDMLQESCKWISRILATRLLCEVNPGSERLGPLAATGILSDSAVSEIWRCPQTLKYQVYPPGITLVPMKSRTQQPFCTTNLVVVIPDNVVEQSRELDYDVYGDALLMDPGCCSKLLAELADIVDSLPRKLVVFVTHHHPDHIDGLSIVMKCNRDAILLAHEKTMNRIGKGKWSLGYTSISGGEKICIGGVKLEALFAPGHTDGHLAMHHMSTNSLIVGDHCVGQGSAVLDITSGGSMKEYFETTYKFLDLSPHCLIPMHGRVDMWPKKMLCDYLKHRRDRELSILRAIEGGALTILDVIAQVYAGLDVKLWIPASSNVRLHVYHLAQQGKLPKGFSITKFRVSMIELCMRFTLVYLSTRKVGAFKLLHIIVAGGLAIALAIIIRYYGI